MKAIGFSFSLFALVACGSGHKANPPVHGAAGAGAKAGAAGSSATGGKSATGGSGGTSGNAGSSDEAGASNGEAGNETGGTGGSSSTHGSSGGTGGSSTHGSSGGSSGTGGSAGTSGAPALAFATFQAAEVVIGQKDFTSNAAPSAPGAASTDYTPGSAAFDGTRLFFADTYTERVLGFSSLPTKNGAAAKVVLGQTGMSAHAAGTTLASLYQPQTLHTDGKQLAVADAGNHRVLLVPVTAASGASASVVVGWPNGTTPSVGCSETLLHSPASAFIGGGKLLVADRDNNRVLIWNKVPKSNGAAADVVLGQSTMTSCVHNDSLANGTVGLRSEATLSGPTDVWSDGKRVLVVDRGNNRVLVWLDFPTASGAAADLVIGQATFDQARDGATASGLYHPSALAYDGQVLFVADAGHNRVLGFSSFPTSNGAAADIVLGQNGFKRVSANDDAQSGHDGGAPTARTLALPSGVAYANGALVVSDTLNRRALVFEPH